MAIVHLVAIVQLMAGLSTSFGGHDTGKTGKLVLTFYRQEKHKEFCCNTGRILETLGKYFDCDFFGLR